MKNYTYKIINLIPEQMENLKKDLGYFIRHGVKCTFRKKVAWIHLNEDQLYTVVTRLMKKFDEMGQLVVRGKLDREGVIISH